MSDLCVTPDTPTPNHPANVVSGFHCVTINTMTRRF